ncbi:hypothetical protein MVEN_01337000 [Mycena venus]|uniref:DUF6534 domain-containing protein n=1 Tax=Mycena venus TaxID=2733690 RepID=A0A8H6XXX7_9AGAR|nr:hypothetical protein MVEN_01337000 [Mycena venus]
MAPSVTYSLGPWVLGISGDLLLQGTLFTQFAHYLALYREDAPALRVFVGGLMLLTTSKSVQGIVILWKLNVDLFSDVQAALEFTASSPFMKLNPAWVALIAFYVQLFFCYRLWIISRNIYFVAAVLSLFVFAFIAACISTAHSFSQGGLFLSWLSIHLGTVFGADFVLCTSMSYFLLKHSKSCSPKTAGMLNAVLKLTFQTAAPAALCAAINFFAVEVNIAKTGHTDAEVYALVAVLANEVLPKLYAVSAMWMLNARWEIRVRHAHSLGRSSDAPLDASRGIQSSGWHRSVPRPVDVELSPVPRVAQDESVPAHIAPPPIHMWANLNLRQIGDEATVDGEVGSVKSSQKAGLW